LKNLTVCEDLLKEATNSLNQYSLCTLGN